MGSGGFNPLAVDVFPEIPAEAAVDHRRHQVFGVAGASGQLADGERRFTVELLFGHQLRQAHFNLGNACIVAGRYYFAVGGCRFRNRLDQHGRLGEAEVAHQEYPRCNEAVDQRIVDPGNPDQPLRGGNEPDEDLRDRHRIDPVQRHPVRIRTPPQQAAPVAADPQQTGNDIGEAVRVQHDVQPHPFQFRDARQRSRQHALGRHQPTQEEACMQRQHDDESRKMHSIAPANGNRPTNRSALVGAG
ncbi:hypothetical protein G6F31_016205 [Rhizopus arrhizus]|nr:hypothetical protein G6F31_016205 [Rhizopus arrhizus]